MKIEKVQDMAFWLLLFGLMGARCIFILTRWDVYMENPLKILVFWEGALFSMGIHRCGFYAHLLHGAHKLPFFKYADLLIPFLAMAHAIGRLGCLMAGCCLVSRQRWRGESNFQVALHATFSTAFGRK